LAAGLKPAGDQPFALKGKLRPPARFEEAALAAVLEKMLGNEGVRRRLGAANRKRCIEVFDWERIVDSLENVYAEVVAG